MSTVSGALAPHQHPAYASLLDALDAGTLSAAQRRALGRLLVSLAVAADMLALPDSEVPDYAGGPVPTAWRLGVAASPIDALRSALDALQYPHGEPRHGQDGDSLECLAAR